MLIFSKAQIGALGGNAREAYLVELKIRLQDRNPNLVRSFNEDRLDQVVRSAAVAAESHGFSNRGPMRLYLDVCVGFGSGFLEDPMLPWAKKAIGDPDESTQTERAEALHQASVVATNEIHGPDAIYTKRGLSALWHWVRDPTPFEETDLREYVVTQMARLHPEKAAHGGEAGLRELYDLAVRTCHEFGMRERRPKVVMSALMFAFGAQCARDPIYGWIGATLTDPRITGPEERFRRLEKKAITWLDAVVMRNESNAA